MKELLEKSFEILPLSNEVILKYCEIYDYLKQRDKLISDVDLMIAATAIVYDAILVTKDSDFERIVETGLKLELRRDQV